MIDPNIISQTGVILAQANELMQNPLISSTVTGFTGWLGKKVFSKSKSAQEKLKLIEQQQADANIIAELRGALENALENNEELQKQLTAELAKVQNQMQQAGVTITNITQQHSGTGDIIGRDKIMGK